MPAQTTEKNQLNKKKDYRNCFLCRVLRGMAFGGMGAALFALPAKWLGADTTNIVYAGLAGALFLTVLFNRKRNDGTRGSG